MSIFTKTKKGIEILEIKKPWDFSQLRDQFKMVLQKAITDNDKYNILNGVPAKSVGEMKLYQTNQGSSLVVGIVENDIIGSYLPDGSCGYAVIQLSFGPEDNQIHITMGNLSYLTVIVNIKPEIDGVMEMVKEKVANYRLFVE